MTAGSVFRRIVSKVDPHYSHLRFLIEIKLNIIMFSLSRYQKRRKQELEQSSKLIADLIASIGRKHFLSCIQRLVHNFTSYDMFVALSYFGDSAPTSLSYKAQAKHPPKLLNIYTTGAYRLDPVFSCCKAGIEPGVYTLRSLSPIEFDKTLYYQTFYGSLGLGDEVDMLVNIPDGGYILLGFARNDTQELFSKDELSMLSILFPIVSVSVQEHLDRTGWGSWLWDKSSDNSLPTGDIFPKLSERQREVALLILRGFNSEDIGRHMGISENTVKVHRRNAYSMLNVTTSIELFVVFLSDCGVSVDAIKEYLNIETSFSL